MYVVVVDVVVTGGRSARSTAGACPKSRSSILLLKPQVRGDARSVGGGRGWLAGDTDGLTGDGGRGRSGRGRHATVSASQEQTLSGRGARVYTAHKGWLGVVTGISQILLR